MDMAAPLSELLDDFVVWVLLLCVFLLGVGVGHFFWREPKTPHGGGNRVADAAPQQIDKPVLQESGTDATQLGSSTDSCRPNTPRIVPPAPDSTTEQSPSVVESASGDVPLAEVPEISTALANQEAGTSRTGRPESETVIQTRTGQNPAREKLVDPFETSERFWSVSETIRAVELYRSGKPIFQIARAMRIDQKQVAIRLIRELFGFQGEINDLANAPRNGKSYTDDELAIMVSYFEAGSSIQDIAAAVERTVLGVGWRMLDRHMV